MPDVNVLVYAHRGDEAVHCRLVFPGSRHWQLVAKLCRETQATGKLVADAQHAAIEHGCEWVSRDTDFHRFERSGLRWQHLDM